MYRSCLLTMTSILILLFTFIDDRFSDAALTNSSDLIYPKESSPFGISFAEWMGKWWQWHVSLPNKYNESDPSNLSLLHPREAYSPDKCEWNQNNQNVWFLADGRNLDFFEFTQPEIRECTVPSDKALLVQIYGGACASSEGFTTDKELKDCVDIGLADVEFTAKVDGVEVLSSENRNDFLPNPYLFNITYPDDNLYNAPSGTFRAMAGGYFLFLKPLSVGNHTVEFNQTYFNPGLEGLPSSESRLSNAIYNLTVK